MSALEPNNCTWGDLLTVALQDCGRLGTGQDATGEDITKAWARGQFMLQEWESKRWMVYHLATYSIVATGQTSYTLGPGGEINTNQVQMWGLEGLAPLSASGGTGYAVNDTINLTATPPSGPASTQLQVKVLSIGSGGVIETVEIVSSGTYPAPLPNQWTQTATSGVGLNAIIGFPTWGLSWNSNTGLPNMYTNPSGSKRPGKIESAFLRQIQISQPNQVDYPFQILQSQEDYNRIALKQLQSFPGAVFLDSQFPLGNLYTYPVPQASIYSINVSVLEQLPSSFSTLATPLCLPFEYFSCITLNLALRLRVTFQIPTFPGDPLPGMAKNAMNTVRGPNVQIARLHMPEMLVRPGIYNIFSDRNY